MVTLYSHSNAQVHVTLFLQKDSENLVCLHTASGCLLRKPTWKLAANEK